MLLTIYLKQKSNLFLALSTYQFQSIVYYLKTNIKINLRLKNALKKHNMNLLYL